MFSSKESLKCSKCIAVIKSNEETVKSHKTNIISLKLQNEKYQEIIDKFTKTN